MTLIDRYISYIRDQKRYSVRTVAIYGDVLKNYLLVTFSTDDVSDEDILASLNVSEIRSYEVHLMDVAKMSPKTVNLHLSVLSGLCRFLIKEDKMGSNPVRLIKKPKVEKRLPEFYRNESLQAYFNNTDVNASEKYLDAFGGRGCIHRGDEYVEPRIGKKLW